MKMYIKIFCIISLTACSENGGESTKDDSIPNNIKVMTFNIHNGFPRGSNTNNVNDYNLNGIISTVNFNGAEIIALNEISNAHKASTRFENQPKLIAEALGLNYDFHGLEINGRFGSALLSKYPILDINHVKYETQGDNLLGIIEAKIQHTDGDLWVYVTHLESGLNNSVRVGQINELKKLASAKDGPKLILGDLNFTPNSNHHSLITTGEFFDPLGKSITPNTFSINNPKRIDYILGNQYINFVTNPWSDTTDRTSDHFPLWAEITIDFN